MSIPGAILVHADGTTERLAHGEAVGRYIIRKATCSHCGQASGPDRKYVCHFASNHQTVAGVSEREITLSRGEKNLGTMVFVEEPA